MRLENIVIDAVDPLRLGRFWEAALGGTCLTDTPELYETRLATADGPTLDLCFPRVDAPSDVQLRLHLDLSGGDDQQARVAHLLTLGATRLDIGQGDVAWEVMADPEGTPFCVMEPRPQYRDTGPIAALPLDSADPVRDMGFWSWLTGWTQAPATVDTTLRDPSRRGPLLECFPEPAAKSPGAKNRIHLDIRLEPGDDGDAVVAEVVRRGGRELDPGWGPLPWRVMADPSGNEWCLLPARDTGDDGDNDGAAP